MDTPVNTHSTSQALQASLYFWWLAFLRCSKDYWWCCQQRGQCQDDRLVRVWQDFGDIHQPKRMMQWWQGHGARLFVSPQIEMDFVKILASGIEFLLDQDLSHPRPGMLCVAIPLSLEAVGLSAAVLEAWDTAHIRGKHYSRDAAYQLTSSSIKSKRMVITAYQSWVLQISIAHMDEPQGAPKWGCYEMGRHLNLSPRNAPRSLDNMEQARSKQKIVRTMFSQNKRAANNLIANVEVGKFPCKDPVPQRARWSPEQQQELDQAVCDGAWQPGNWLRAEHAFLLPEHVLAPLGGDASARSLDLGAVANFGALATPFLIPKRLRKKTAPGL